MSASRPNSAYSFKTAALHAALFVIAFMLSAGAASVAWARNPEAAGKLIGYLFWVAIGLGLLVSVLFQRGHRGLGFTLSVVLCAAYPAFLFFVTRATSFTPAERIGLKVDADSVRHRELGFAFPSPGLEFALADSLPTAALTVVRDQPVFMWVLHNADSTETVMVTVVKGLKTEDDLRRFATGVRRQLERLATSVVEDTIEWNDAVREARFAVQTETGYSIAWRCSATLRAQPGLLTCVMTASPDQQRLADVRGGLSWNR